MKYINQTPLPIAIAAKTQMLDYIKCIEPTTIPTGIRKVVRVWFPRKYDDNVDKCSDFMNYDISEALSYREDVGLKIYSLGVLKTKNWFYAEVELHYKFV